MILGMKTSTFTLLHVLISLVGIGSGFVVMYGLVTARRLNRWTVLFLASTAATSITGFLFPFEHVTPGIVVGILSMIVLGIAVVARYNLQLKGIARPLYVVCASVALYFNVFVLVVQSFEKSPVLRALAPTQKEPPFAIAQLLVLAVFVALAVMAVKRFRPDASLAEGASGSSTPANQERVA
jgi:hypothetical protein